MSKKDRATLLSKHKRKGKTLVSPFSIFGERLEPSSWSDRFPEFIWISLIIHHFGLKDGVQILEKIAKALKTCPERNERFDFTMSMLKDKVSEKQAEDMIQSLSENERKNLLFALSPLLIYPKNPFNYILQLLMKKPFIFATKESYARIMCYIVAKLLNRHSRLSGETNTTFLYLLTMTDQIKFIEDAQISFENIKKSEGSEEFLQTAKSSNNFSKVILAQSNKRWWSKHFWNTNLKNTICI